MDTNAKQELLRKSYTKLYADQNLDALVTCVGKAFKNNLTEKMIGGYKYSLFQ